MKFLLTKELGRLAKWLRILGFDTAYFKEGNYSSLVIAALRDARVILTRNHRLPEARGLRIVVLKEEKLKEQLREIFKELKIEPGEFTMFSRCTLCNLELKPLDKHEVKDKVPEYVYNTQDKFFCCPSCRKIYWQGTHWGNVQKTLDEIKWNS